MMPSLIFSVSFIPENHLAVIILFCCLLSELQASKETFQVSLSCPVFLLLLFLFLFCFVVYDWFS